METRKLQKAAEKKKVCCPLQESIFEFFFLKQSPVSNILGFLSGGRKEWKMAVFLPQNSFPTFPPSTFLYLEVTLSRGKGEVEGRVVSAFGKRRVERVLVLGMGGTCCWRRHFLKSH